MHREERQPVAKVGGDQIHSVPVISRVGGDASHGSRMAVAPMVTGRSGLVASASDCGVRGPRFESHRGRLCLMRWPLRYVYSLGHGLRASTAVPRSTRPSNLRGTEKRVSVFGLSNTNKWRWRCGWQTQPKSIGWVWGLIGGHPALSLRSSSEPGECLKQRHSYRLSTSPVCQMPPPLSVRVSIELVGIGLRSVLSRM